MKNNTRTRKGLYWLMAAMMVSAMNVKAQKKNCEPDTNKMVFDKFDVMVIEKSRCDSSSAKPGDKNPEKKSSGKFSYWGGFYMGINGLITPDGSTDLGKVNEYLQPDYSKCFTFGLNFINIKFKLIPNRLGLTTGLGVQWNRYGFKNNYTLLYNNDSVYGRYDSTVNYTKNRLRATYLNVPLLFEIKSGKSKSKSFHAWVGGILSFKVGSRLRQEYEFNGHEYELQNKGHYQLNPLLYYASVGIGYGKHIRLFANYGLNTLFEKNRGPEVVPFTIGLYIL